MLAPFKIHGGNHFAIDAREIVAVLPDPQNRIGLCAIALRNGAILGNVSGSVTSVQTRVNAYLEIKPDLSADAHALAVKSVEQRLHIESKLSEN